MNIYYLKSHKTLPIYDVMTAAVVIAWAPRQARAIANEHCESEGAIWADPATVTCSKIGVVTNVRNKQPGLLLAQTRDG